MARRIALCVSVIVGLAMISALGQVAPVVVQPMQAGLSSALLTEFQNQVTNLERALGNHLLGSKRALGAGGWTAQQFAAYTAGSLERLGYAQTALVTATDATGTARVWVLVGLTLSNGATLWVPVEPFPSTLPYQQNLGKIAWAGTLQYDAAYVSYDQTIELADNIPPVASIRPPMSDIVETRQSAWFGNTSIDPDGEIVLYQWTFGDVAEPETYTISVWFTFKKGGKEYPVTLTVTDSRGAQATATTTVYVMTVEEKEADDCGCHDG